MKRQSYSMTAKKIIAGSLAAAMCFSGGIFAQNTVSKTEAAALTFGDVNGDEKINLLDAKYLLRLAVGIQTPTADEIVAGDMDFNKKLDLNDAKILLKVSVGIQELPDNGDEPTETPGQTSNPPKPVIPDNPDDPGDNPIVTPPSVQPSIQLPKVEPGEVVTGTAIQNVEGGLNGATFDAVNGIYTFTDENKAAKRGIHFSNPWAGRADLKQAVESVLPYYLEDASGNNRGIIKDNKLVSLDGKTVYGDITEKDGYLEVQDASSDAAQVITGTAVRWHEGMFPSVNTIDTASNYNPDYKELYATPDWTNGVSISFWCKYDWTRSYQSDASPMLVIKNSHGCDNNPGGQFSKTGHTGDFGIMVRLNGGVSFEGDETGNCFRTGNYIAGVDGEWNYYTVTFANDWVTVYINGQELVYTDVEIDKDLVGFFNNGFLTRYNPIYQVSKEEVGESDIRNYLKKGWISEQGQQLSVLDKECCVIGNDRYHNPEAVTIKKNSNGLKYDLLVDLLVKEDTEIWFGSTSETQCNCLTSQASTGVAEYSLKTGTQLANVTCYYSELTAPQVAANYEKECQDNAEKFELNKD